MRPEFLSQGWRCRMPGRSVLPGVVTDCHSVPDFEPSLVEPNRKYMFTAPQAVNAYLERFFRVCLPEEQRRSMHEAHPRLDTDVCYPPKVDENILRWAGQRFPKPLDTQLSALQLDTLAAIGSATCLLSAITEMDSDQDDFTVPVTDAKDVLQHTLVLLGDVIAGMNSLRRQLIVEAVDKAVAKAVKQVPMPTSGRVLFGDTFTEEVSKRIKADQALGEIQKLVRQPKPTSTTSQRPFRPKGFPFRRGRDQKPYDSISSHRYGSVRQQANNYFRHGQTSNFRASGFRSPPSRQHNRSLPGPPAGRPASGPPTQ